MAGLFSCHYESTRIVSDGSLHQFEYNSFIFIFVSVIFVFSSPLP